MLPNAARKPAVSLLEQNRNEIPASIRCIKSVARSCTGENCAFPGCGTGTFYSWNSSTRIDRPFKSPPEHARTHVPDGIFLPRVSYLECLLTVKSIIRMITYLCAWLYDFISRLVEIIFFYPCINHICVRSFFCVESLNLFRENDECEIRFHRNKYFYFIIFNK